MVSENTQQDFFDSPRPSGHDTPRVLDVIGRDTLAMVSEFGVDKIRHLAQAYTPQELSMIQKLADMYAYTHKFEQELELYRVARRYGFMLQFVVLSVTSFLAFFLSSRMWSLVPISLKTPTCFFMFVLPLLVFAFMDALSSGYVLSAFYSLFFVMDYTDLDKKILFYFSACAPEDEQGEELSLSHLAGQLGLNIETSKYTLLSRFQALGFYVYMKEGSYFVKLVGNTLHDS